MSSLPRPYPHRSAEQWDPDRRRSFQANAPVGAVAWDNQDRRWLYSDDDALDHLTDHDLDWAAPDGGEPARPARIVWCQDADGPATNAGRETLDRYYPAVTALLSAAWRDGVELGDLLAEALTAVAREVGGSDQLVRYRPGSWEAQHLIALAAAADYAEQQR